MGIEQREVMQELCYVICDIDRPDMLDMSPGTKVEIGLTINLFTSSTFPFGKMTILLENSSEHVMVCKAEDGRRITINPRFIAYTGEVKREEADNS